MKIRSKTVYFPLKITTMHYSRTFWSWPSTQIVPSVWMKWSKPLDFNCTTHLSVEIIRSMQLDREPMTEDRIKRIVRLFLSFLANEHALGFALYIDFLTDSSSTNDESNNQNSEIYSYVCYLLSCLVNLWGAHRALFYSKFIHVSSFFPFKFTAINK